MATKALPTLVRAIFFRGIYRDDTNNEHQDVLAGLAFKNKTADRSRSHCHAGVPAGGRRPVSDYPQDNKLSGDRRNR